MNLTAASLLLVVSICQGGGALNPLRHENAGPDCDPPCDDKSDAPHCYVTRGRAKCGCVHDDNCPDPQVCAESLFCDHPTRLVHGCAKQCGCHVGTTEGCDPDSDAPFCTASIGGGACMCRDDADCDDGEECVWRGADHTMRCGKVLDDTEVIE